MNDRNEYLGRTIDPDAASAPKPKRKAGERFRLFNAFVDFTLRELSRIEIAVWLVLYRDAKADGIARTGQADIARRIGASDRTVRRALRQLEGRGLLVIVRRGRIGSGPSAYRVQGVDRGEAMRTKLCPVVSGQNGAFTEDKAVSAIPEWDHKRRRALMRRATAK